MNTSYPIYVLCESYPTDENIYSMAFVHSRTKVYNTKGLNVKVISFSAMNNYSYDGIDVLTVKYGLKELKNKNDVLIVSHAPNLKHHFPFLFKVWPYFNKIIFFFHGHEVLNIAKYYPYPYKFKKEEISQYKKGVLYDYIKLPLMKLFLRFLLKNKNVELVFVSNWMLNAASISLKINFKKKYPDHIHIINNVISPYIVSGKYKLNEKSADFLSIRPLDQSKYAMDLIVEFANSNPQYTFHIYGKGDYFKVNPKPQNITVINKFVSQQDFMHIMNQYKYAIMPTRLDAQGVMMCEMACYGIPIIVSDIEICHEMLDGLNNVEFVKNTSFNSYKMRDIPVSDTSLDRFSQKNTIDKELILIQQMLSK